MNKTVKIYVAGHRGMVGSSICKNLVSNGYNNIVVRSSSNLDLRNQKEVDDFFETEKPDVVIDAAARVGGILANNNYPYQFLLENMQMQNNLIDAAHRWDTKKFIFLGSSCIYPKMAPQPLKEEYLLTSTLETTNEWYAIAKISGVKLCESVRKQFGKDFVSLMPTNMYGPFDNYDLNTSHVLPAMLRKFHDAKQNDQAPVTLWGTGTPMREFMHVEDLANAVLFALEQVLPDNLYNVGYGSDVTIKKLAQIIQEQVGHQGEIIWDSTKPDGTPRKWMDSSKMKALGWKPKYTLEEGISKTYQWFLKNIEHYKEVKL